MGEPHLNGAFYGPSIPPPSKSYHRPGRGSSGGGGCCCGLLGCCCNCLFGCIFNLIFQILCTVLIIVAVLAFIFWLVFRPNPVKFSVTDASLTQFDLSSTNNTLYYNLALNMTIRNPNQRIGIYYDQINATAFYGGERFGSSDLGHFYQGHKKTDYLNPVFKGQKLVLLGDKGKSEFESDKSSGTYGIDVKLYLKVRFKVWWVKPAKFKPRIECDLKVPLDSNGKASGKFEPKRCDFDWRHWALIRRH